METSQANAVAAALHARARQAPAAGTYIPEPKPGDTLGKLGYVREKEDPQTNYRSRQPPAERRGGRWTPVCRRQGFFGEECLGETTKSVEE